MKKFKIVKKDKSEIVLESNTLIDILLILLREPNNYGYSLENIKSIEEIS